MTSKQIIDILRKELKPIIEETVTPIIEEQLKPVHETLEVHGRKIDALTADMHVVRKLAETSVDIVKARYEKNKREIDEIKNHLHLPKEPYFAE